VKLRITSEDLRLRLAPEDTASIAAGERVRETLRLPGGDVHVELLCEGREIGAALVGDTVCVRIPVAQATRWASGDEVTLTAELPNSRIVIEKDLRPS
tara:strand:+ start:2390 stop:2683 length:294 start_codon:yes stop_codon:yes gene_type:complete